jgi:N-acetylglucosaminyldiphosphoundecaprenol N-acetyl-beta-D-mannosaminyltransferase
MRDICEEGRERPHVPRTLRSEPVTTRFLGVDVSVVDQRAVVDRIGDALRDRELLRISFLNPFYARRAARDADLRHLMNSFDLLPADGWGIILGARLLGARLPERVAIEDFERPLFDLLSREHRRVFLFGSEPGMAEQAAETLRRTYPDLVVAGVLHGWWDAQRGHPGRFDEVDNDAIIRSINDSGADMLFVGLPTPLQQRWVIENAAALSAPVIMTVGAYFDHLAERLDWYPRWMDRARLDWLYRVAREPRRLWRRYSFGSVDFGRLVLAERLRRGAP